MTADPCVREALFWRPLEDGEVECFLCRHGCHVGQGKRGMCGVRVNQGGKLLTMVYGRLVAERPDPIEKKPLFHYLPGSSTHSIATEGCNLRCANCQNFTISQPPREGKMPNGTFVSPELVVAHGLGAGCSSISYTYTEPTIFGEYALDVMALAHEKGLANIFVSNGFMGEKPLAAMKGLLDAANIDLKSMKDEFYRKVCGARLDPVLENIKTMKDMGVWVELTTLLIPTLNDTEDELRSIARFIASVDKGIPWHVSGFFPTFKLLELPPTTGESLLRAREIGMEEGLSFVYTGNRSASGGENTICPACGKKVISRNGFSLGSLEVDGQGACGGCGGPIPGRYS